MATFKCLVILLVVYNVVWTNAEKIMRPRVKDIKMWSDNVHVTHSIVYDGADPHVNISMTALQELHDIDIHTELEVVQKQDPTYFLSLNSTINICRIINWRNQSPIGNLIHAYMKEYGNLFETCPVAKGTYRIHKHFHGHKFQGEYFMHKFWIPEDTSTALLPEVDFDIKFSAYHVDSNRKRTLIINDHIMGEAVVQDVNNVKRGILAMLPKAG